MFQKRKNSDNFFFLFSFESFHVSFSFSSVQLPFLAILPYREAAHTEQFIRFTAVSSYSSMMYATSDIRHTHITQSLFYLFYIFIYFNFCSFVGNIHPLPSQWHTQCPQTPSIPIFPNVFELRSLRVFVR